MTSGYSRFRGAAAGRRGSCHGCRRPASSTIGPRRCGRCRRTPTGSPGRRRSSAAASCRPPPRGLRWLPAGSARPGAPVPATGDRCGVPSALSSIRSVRRASARLAAARPSHPELARAASAPRSACRKRCAAARSASVGWVPAGISPRSASQPASVAAVARSSPPRCRVPCTLKLRSSSVLRKSWRVTSAGGTAVVPGSSGTTPVYPDTGCRWSTPMLPFSGVASGDRTGPVPMGAFGVTPVHRGHRAIAGTGWGLVSSVTRPGRAANRRGPHLEGM